MGEQAKRRVGRSRRAGWLRSGVLMGALAGTAALAGCRVSESDVERWETTERGPIKLVAVVTHDKYDPELRVKAAISLVHMPPRGGVRKGLSFLVDKYQDERGQQLPGALPSLSEDQRKLIVNGMAPELIQKMGEAPPPRTAEGRLPPDPTIPYKDAAFAMLVHEPPLVSDPETKKAFVEALTKWSQTAFEDRIENGAQQYGIEQMMRHLGGPTVKTLPSLINENTARLDRIAGLIADLGDAETKAKASENLVALAKKIHSKEWHDASVKLIQESNAKANTKATDEQVQKQFDKFQETKLTSEVFPAMKRVGGRPVVEYLYAYSADTKNSEDRRKLAMAALEGRVDKNNAQDLERAFAIARDENQPDAVRQVAFNRMGEFPKEQIVPKLYTLFTPKKWKTRWVAAETVLKASNQKGVPEFMSKLPSSAATKMAMTEPLSYGAAIAKMEGEPKPLDVIKPYLASRELGPKLTALGFFWDGKKADVPLVKPYEEDKLPLPKCDKEDECDWKCEVPKPGAPAGETETKELATVGDFVKHCLVPTMTH